MGACVAAPDTLFSVSQDSTLKLFSLSAGRQLRSINVSELALSACVLTPDEKRLLIASWDNNVYLYSAEHGRVLDTLAAHDDAVSCLAMRGESLVTGSWDSTVKLWSVRPAGIAKAPLADFIDNETEVRAIDISPDGRLVVSGAADGTMMVADLRSKAPGKLFRGHSDALCAVRFSHDGQFILSASADKTLRMFRVGSYTNPVTVVKGNEKLTCMWIDEGAALVGSAEGALRLYSVTSSAITERKCLRDQRSIKDSAGKATEPISCIAVSRDRDLIVTGAGADGTIRMWRAPS
jgi:factor associated with neutral sphingomyelinase activation